VRSYSRVVSSPWTNTCFFEQPIGHLREALAERDDVMPLSFLLPGVILVLPERLVATENFVTGVPVGRDLVSAFWPTNPIIES